MWYAGAVRVVRCERFGLGRRLANVSAYSPAGLRPCRVGDTALQRQNAAQVFAGDGALFFNRQTGDAEADLLDTGAAEG